MPDKILYTIFKRSGMYVYLFLKEKEKINNNFVFANGYGPIMNYINLEVIKSKLFEDFYDKGKINKSILNIERGIDVL